MGSSSSNGGSSLQQLMLIVTDGRFNKQNVAVQVQKALAKRILPLLVIVDQTEPAESSKTSATAQAGSGSSSTAAAAAVKRRRSIFDMKAVAIRDGVPEVSSYLDDFPFPFYAVVQDLESLPQLFADVLRQWISL